MENDQKPFQTTNSFHLAGIIPIAGQPLDFEMDFQQLLDGVRKKFLHNLMPIFSGKPIFSTFRCIFSNPSKLFVLILFIGH